MKRNLKAVGFVLKKTPLINRGLLLSVFTEAIGKITISAPGIRTILSRRLSHIDTGNLISIGLDEKNNRFYLKETLLISGFTKIKSSRDKIACLMTFLFVLEKILPEGQSENEIYQLLKKFLVEISKEDNSERIILIDYLNKLMLKLGYSHKSLEQEQLFSFITNVIGEKIPLF